MTLGGIEDEKPTDTEWETAAAKNYNLAVITGEDPNIKVVYTMEITTPVGDLTIISEGQDSNTDEKRNKQKDDSREGDE